MKSTDIIVIGAGPAGLGFAACLANTGLNITILEKSSESVISNPPYDGREIALTQFTKEHLEDLGIWQLIPENERFPLKDAKVQNGTSSQLLYFQAPGQARGKVIDQLGYFVSNHMIRLASYQRVKSLPNVQIVFDAEVDKVHTSNEGATACLKNGEVYEGQLLVLADSRFSSTRAQMGFSVDYHQFGRTVVAFRMTHEQSNHCTAFEMFHYGRTLALLPLGEYMTNMVLTIDTAKAQRFMDMTDEELEEDIYQETQGRLGRLKITKDGRHTYPLMGTHARCFYVNRCALIGDAAVGMHPVTAHGYNLGLESAKKLSALIINAHQAGQPIYDKALLSKYNAQHQLRTRFMYHGTNTIVKLFTKETSIAHFVRESVISVSRHLPPVTRLISKQLTG